MQIHLFISDHALAGSRLRARLHDYIQKYPVIQYNSLEAIGQVIPLVYNEPAVAVIMLGKKEELSLLADRKYIHDSYKTILVVPDNDADTFNLGLSLRPVIITHMDSDFNEVNDILFHIKDRSEMQMQNFEYEITPYKKSE